MQVELQMVGYYQHRNCSFKGVDFIKGRAFVNGADELVGNICRYLETYGAYPPHEAEKRQAVLDRAAGLAGDMRGAKARLERATREAQEAQDQLDQAREVAEQRLLQEEEEASSGSVQDKPTSEGRSSKSSSNKKDSKPAKGEDG